MRNLAIVACVVAVALGAAAILVAQTAAPSTPATASAPAGTWTVVLKSADLKEAKLPKEWTVITGDVSVKDGAIEMKGGDSDSQIVLTKPKCTASVKVEFDGTVTGDKVSDISPVLNADEDGFASGYLLQFGGKANTKDQLIKESETVDATAKDKPLLKAGQKYHVIAENDGGTISLTVDGTKVFEYKDPRPLKGNLHGCVGFYTYGDTLKIENLVVSQKEAAK